MFWRINRKCKKMTDDGWSENLSAQVSCKRFLTCLIFKTCKYRVNFRDVKYTCWYWHDFEFQIQIFSYCAKRGGVCIISHKPVRRCVICLRWWPRHFLVLCNNRGNISDILVDLLDTRIQGETVLGYKNLSNI